jgi:hypothetical protein
MLLSSGWSDRGGEGFAVVGAVSEHDPEDVEASPGEGDESLLVGFAFGSFAFVEGS